MNTGHTVFQSTEIDVYSLRTPLSPRWFK